VQLAGIADRHRLVRWRGSPHVERRRPCFRQRVDAPATTACQRSGPEMLLATSSTPLARCGCRSAGDSRTSCSQWMFSPLPGTTRRRRYAPAFATQPVPSPELGLRIAFVADPDGNLVELLSRQTRARVTRDRQ
jgi:hypothetical protein